MKAFRLLIFLVPLISVVRSTEIECRYGYNRFKFPGSLYHCQITKNINISLQENLQVTGIHQSGHDNNKVHAIWSEGKTIEHFPKGFEEIFKNIRLIIIRNGLMKDIHQSDLKPFRKLERLELSTNDIEVLEEGLFDFNPKLKWIWLNNNKIIKIHPNVFDGLTELTSLYLKGNKCINRNAENAAAVKDSIHEVFTKCSKTETCENELKSSMSCVTKEALEHEMKDIKKELSDNLEAIVGVCEPSGSAIDSQRIENIEKSLENFKHQVSSALLNLMGKMNDLKEAVDGLNKNGD